MIEAVYAFVDDEAVYPARQTNSINSSVAVPGLMDINIQSYFSNIGNITCLADDRFTQMPAYQTGQGDLNLYFDKEFSPKLGQWVDTTPTDPQIIFIFNIIEFLLRSDCTTTAQEAIIENTLVDNTSGKFTGYEPNSMSLSRQMVNIPWNSVQADSTYRDFETTIGFVFLTDGTNGYEFHLSISPQVFETIYPYTKIGMIIPPIPLENIIDPSYHDIISAIISAGTYMNDQIKIAEKNANYTDNAIFKTECVVDSQPSPEFPFAILYHGKTPSSNIQSTAIRQFLEDSLVATAETWATVFPELYVNARFLLVPIWDNIQPLPTIDLDKCIIPINSLKDALTQRLPGMDKDLIDTMSDAVIPPAGYMYIAVIPDGSNPQHIWEVHPTYQGCDPIGVTYGYQTELTKQFNRLLSDCMAQLNGIANATIFKKAIHYGKGFYSFYVGTVEYCVMEKSEYFKE
ncbi:MAG: hypothetical protein GY804_09085 [Alphaproteobacteria bacterium]|nr:hypothetical protein [Alphaproteobacteria bacterium]